GTDALGTDACWSGFGGASIPGSNVAITFAAYAASPTPENPSSSLDISSRIPAECAARRLTAFCRCLARGGLFLCGGLPDGGTLDGGLFRDAFCRFSCCRGTSR